MQKNENRPGYKKTKVGWIPDEWALVRAREVCTVITKGTTPRSRNHGKVAQPVPYLRVQNLSFDGTLLFEKDRLFVDKACHDSELSRSRLFPGDILINIVGPPLGKVSRVPALYPEWNMNQAVAVFRLGEGCEEVFLCHYLQTKRARSWLDSQSKKTSGQKNLTLEACKALPIPLPPLPEQEAIAGVLECWDKAIRYYEKKIEKKRNIKNGLMQKLLSGEQRLAGFSEEWKEVRLGEICDVLDSQRKPLNEEARSSMQGDIPYYGANGVLDHINDYIFNEELVLVAEDGGHFEEFATRPIAQLVKGRTWVNNHAHVLRAKNGENAFLFFSLVHRNILKHLNSGTRAKLNKSELISICLSYTTQDEQQAIANLLSVADAEINALERKLRALKNQKRFLLNDLVAGTIRLPQFVGAAQTADTKGDTE